MRTVKDSITELPEGMMPAQNTKQAPPNGTPRAMTPNDDKKPYFKIPPELVDGQHWTFVDNASYVIEAVKEWCAENGDCIGDSFTIEVVEMSEAEVNALPEI